MMEQSSSSKAKLKPEKRLKRARTICPMPIQKRIDRAKTQQMFLIKRSEVESQHLRCEFVVLGSTGNVYTVTIQRLPHCTCPDHAKGNLCKHILFVLLKVMALNPESTLIFQAAWIGAELKQMYKQMGKRFRQLSGTILANETVRRTFAQLEAKEDDLVLEGVARKEREEGDDCPICFDTLGDVNATTYCRSQCGANFHQVCIRHWLQQNHTKPTCPMCRAPWEDKSKKSSSGGNVNSEGFTNLGRLQGQSPDRDTSSYSAWSPYSRSRKKRRRWR